MANLSPIEQYDLICYLDKIKGIKWTDRNDLAIDDYSYQIIPLEEMKEAHQEGNNFGYQRQWFEGTNGNKETEGSITEYFGAKTSDKKVRIYSHKNKCMRFEAQLRGSYAEAAIKKLVSLERTTENDEEWSLKIQQTLGSIAVGTIDFRDKSKLKNKNNSCVNKTKRLTFWQEFIDQIGDSTKIKIATNKAKNETLESVLKWMYKYVKKRLAMLLLTFGEEYILRLAKEGVNSLTAKDYKTIECWKNEINRN